MDTTCKYYKVTDATVHALRWDGQRNVCEATDQWECGACGSKHTARLGTPLYRLKTASERVKLAVHMAMKSMNIASISEILGYSEQTITRWLERAGLHSSRLHDRWFRNMVLRHIQLALARLCFDSRDMRNSPGKTLLTIQCHLVSCSEFHLIATLKHSPNCLLPFFDFSRVFKSHTAGLMGSWWYLTRSPWKR
jgi:hypothetical protein